MKKDESKKRVQDKTHLAVSLSNVVPNGRQVTKEDREKFLKDRKIRLEAENKIEAENKKPTKKD